MEKRILKLIVGLFVFTQSFGQTFELFDLNLSGDFQPKYFTEYNGMLIFQAKGNDGVELWKSDGTKTGTVQIKNINTNLDESSDPKYFTEFNGKLYFEAMGQLWVTDGSENGTQLVSDAVRPTVWSAVANNLLFFSGVDANGIELWVTDGTKAGTFMVKDINPGSWSSGVSELIAYKNNVIFVANNGTNGGELWKSDGTSLGTKMIKDIKAGSDSSRADFLTEYSGSIYFSAETNSTGNELWKTDGTSSGTVMVKDIFSGGDSSNPSKLYVYSQSLFFQADSGDNHGLEMYKYNLSANTVTREADVYDGPDHGGFGPVISFNEGMYFLATKPATGNELYVRRNGFNSLAEDTNPGSAGSGSSAFCECGGNMYYRATKNGKLGLFEFSKNTNNAIEIKPASAVNEPFLIPITTEIFCFNGSIYFAANYTSSGFDMWKYTPSTLSVNDIKFKNADLTIYPNPVKSNLNISLKNNELIQQIDLYNLVGQKVYQKKVSSVKKVKANLSHLASNIYIVKIKTENSIYSGKIILKK
jgi:ELWxxDGT repeat protein